MGYYTRHPAKIIIQKRNKGKVIQMNRLEIIVISTKWKNAID